LSAVAGARLAAALAHIAESFTEPGLTLAAVARRQGVSLRYLQRPLEPSGMSFHRPRDRAALAESFRAADQSARPRAPDFRHRLGDRIFRYLRIAD
jgi:AraC-like DNA-binding protein